MFRHGGVEGHQLQGAGELLVAVQFVKGVENRKRAALRCARLHFSRAQKYLGVFDQNKAETRVPIASLDEI